MVRKLDNANTDNVIEQILIEGHRIREVTEKLSDFLLKFRQNVIESKVEFTVEVSKVAAGLVEDLGRSALYWKEDIAVQMTVLAQCTLSYVTINVEAEQDKVSLAKVIAERAVLTFCDFQN